MDKAVILSSGGINSSVAAAVAGAQYEPALLHVAWGHRAASGELLAFQKVSTALNFKTTMVAQLECLVAFGGSARVDRRFPVEDANCISSEPPATYMLGLLPSMLSLAATWAGSLRAKRIIVGISEDHAVSGPVVSKLYPDHRMDFLQTFNLMLHYAKPANRELKVEAPLIDLTRSEVIQLGQRLNVPFDQTWSCYAKSNTACGRCWACATRAQGFLQSGIPDPLLLEAAPAR